MKRLTKFTAVFLVLLLLVANIASTAFAAVDATLQPGETVKLTLDLGKVYGVNGELTVSNAEDFTVTLSGSGVSGKKCYFFSDTTEAKQLTYQVTVVANAAAVDGDSCTITLKYEDWNATGDSATERTITKNVVVDIPAPQPPESKPTEPKPTQPKPTTPDTPATKPTSPSNKVDYSELEKQIKLANALTPNGYSDETWTAMVDALNKANKAMKSDKQADVDKTAADLAAAIAALKKVDYTQLEQIISSAESLLTSTDLTNAFNNLFKGLEEAKGLLQSNSQKAVDEGVEKVKALIDALEKALAELGQGEKDPAAPSDPAVPGDEYCNIPMHYVWPILFFISLAVNVVFVALLVLYLVKRKKNRTDNTPLVDYDIGDDA